MRVNVNTDGVSRAGWTGKESRVLMQVLIQFDYRLVEYFLSQGLICLFFVLHEVGLGA